MAVKTWEAVKIRFCEHASSEVALEAEKVYPKLRGKMFPEVLFDKVQKLRDEYRAGANNAVQNGIS